MRDLIDRADAIDALVEEKGIINGILDSLMLGNEARKKWEVIRGRILDDIEIIANLPSAQPEQQWSRLMMYLADLQLTYSPNWGANGQGDQKLYDFVTGLIEELEGWEDKSCNEDSCPMRYKEDNND